MPDALSQWRRDVEVDDDTLEHKLLGLATTVSINYMRFDALEREMGGVRLTDPKARKMAARRLVEVLKMDGIWIEPPVKKSTKPIII